MYIYNPQRSTCCVFLPVFTWFHNNFVLSSKSLIFEDGLFIRIYNIHTHQAQFGSSPLNAVKGLSWPWERRRTQPLVPVPRMEARGCVGLKMRAGNKK